MPTTSSIDTYTATQNACKLCTPLGAALVFKGVANCIPLLHGSQGCSTYIRRYMISHFREPLDIACSNFAEDTAIFGGGANLVLAIDNIRRQYAPDVIGVATTCLSETIGDDVPMFIRRYREQHRNEHLPDLIHVATPSYRGTHMQGFHDAVHALISGLARVGQQREKNAVNIFPGMVSPADLRQLKEILVDFGLQGTLVPDYSETLNGPLWTEYQKIPPGGVPVDELRRTGRAAATIECGRVLAEEPKSGGTWLQEHCGVPLYRIGLPVGIDQSDTFFQLLASISGRPIPAKYAAQRGRLLDALVDSHKHLNGVRAAIFGEEDLVAGLAQYCSEVGVIPVLCATGGGRGRFQESVCSAVPAQLHPQMEILEDADFVTIENAVTSLQANLLIGHSKGYRMSRRLGVPLVRAGFPVHDRLDGSRLLHLSYRGAQQLLDRIVNTLVDAKQQENPVGYTYY